MASVLFSHGLEKGAFSIFVAKQNRPPAKPLVWWDSQDRAPLSQSQTGPGPPLVAAVI